MATPSAKFPGWNKTDAKTLTHESGNARVTLKERRDNIPGARKFQVRVNGDWIYQREVTGSGNWIAEFSTLETAIAAAEKRMKGITP